MAKESFSFQELHDTTGIKMVPIQSLIASDGVELSYRKYVPLSPVAAVLFYHGGGAHSGAGYQYFGNALKTEYNILVYTPDIRGHGNSGGIRGDTPSPKQVWNDITTFIKHIRTKFSNLPLFLGGHSSGAGLSLNYASQPDREKVNGYLFLSPQFGSRSGTERPSLTAPFARVNASAFTGYFASRGKLNGHNFAVRFNYPAEILESDPGLVSSITINMSVSLIPSKPAEQFAAIDRPFGLWIGSDDELFQPVKVLAFGTLVHQPQKYSTISSIPGAKHLSVLINAHKTIGPWITSLVKVKAV